MRQWLPDRAKYLHEILDMERLPANECSCGVKENLIQCLDCFSTDIFCRACCLESHKFLPFHRINRWNGRFFTRSSLHAQGFIMHLGHNGNPCPRNTTVAHEVRNDDFVEGMGISSEEKDTDVEDGWLNLEAVLTERVVVIIHTTGVFQHHVWWCTCPDHAKEDIQLLHSKAPAPHKQCFSRCGTGRFILPSRYNLPLLTMTMYRIVTGNFCASRG